MKLEEEKIVYLVDMLLKSYALVSLPPPLVCEPPSTEKNQYAGREGERYSLKFNFGRRRDVATGRRKREKK